MLSRGKLDSATDVWTTCPSVGDDAASDCESPLYDAVVSCVYVVGSVWTGTSAVEELVVTVCESDVSSVVPELGWPASDVCPEDGYLVTERRSIEKSGDIGCCTYIGCSCND